MDLRKYGLEDKFPKLAKLQEEVQDLERCRGEAERDVMTARHAVEAAKEQDAEAAAKALRSGKAMPKASREEKAKAELEAAERTLSAYAKALEGAQSDLGHYMNARRAEIRASILDALHDKAAQLRVHATAAAQLYAAIEDSRYTLRDLAPPAVAEYSGEAQPLTVAIVGAVQTTKSAGPARGDVEGILRYLATLEAQFAGPSEATEEAGAA
jgi:hypothetical protein